MCSLGTLALVAALPKPNDIETRWMVTDSVHPPQPYDHSSFIIHSEARPYVACLIQAENVGLTSLSK